MSTTLIDTTGTRRHVRHVVAEKLEGRVKTKCNRVVRYYWEADSTSYFYTNGERYSTPCRRCLPDEYSKMIEKPKN